MIKRVIRRITCAALILIFIMPLIMTVASSLMSSEELSAIYNKNNSFRWIPYQVTLEGYWRLLFESDAYLSTFWNSMFIALSSTILQVTFSLIVGYALTRVNFRGKGMLNAMYILMMLMPFQVTLLPNYMLAKRIGIYDTWLALILPNAFAAFGVVLMREFIKGISGEVLEAAYMDTSSNLRVMLSIVAPNIYAGALTLAVITFAESWNMVEQPLILLESEWLYPLSLRLTALEESALDIYFAGAVLYVIPAVLIYLIFRDELVEGITQIRM